jgi:protoheme IX farnesyltransferase
VPIYGELAKSRLSALVVTTTGAGHLMAAGPVDPACLASTLGGTFLCSASANSFNQIIETRNDASMNRTCRRPLPSGRISREHAIGWASAAGVAGVGTLAMGTNCMTTALGAATLGLYTLVYTPMKQRTPLNTWVGAVVGAIPPVMGWTAAGGALLSVEAAALGSALFLWQMPHFFALSWM